MTDNPFVERSRITKPEHFAGRWSELSLIFDAIQAGRPVLITGSPGIGKSTLLSHIADAAATNLERDDMRAFYLDLADAESGGDVYRAVVMALDHRGDTPAALEVALLGEEEPPLLSLDNAQAVIAAGWGVEMLEALARIARGGSLLLVVGMNGQPPLLSERFVQIRLGAFVPAEIRLLAEAYLDGTGVQFTPAELRALTDLSVAHPAYVQRAAYHLFRSKLEPGYNWRAAYLQEARERPVPGAPLPPAVFEGAEAAAFDPSQYDAGTGGEGGARPQSAALPELEPALVYLLPVLIAALLLLTTSSVPLALLVAVAGLALIVVLRRRRT